MNTWTAGFTGPRNILKFAGSSHPGVICVDRIGIRLLLFLPVLNMIPIPVQADFLTTLVPPGIGGTGLLTYLWPKLLGMLEK